MECSKARRAAIYLVSQGTLRSPRFLELQYERIHRYRSVAKACKDEEARKPFLFVDLHHDRRDYITRFQLPDLFPQLAALADDVKAGYINIVYVDLCMDGAQPSRILGIPEFLINAGAEVVNVYSDPGGLLCKKIVEEYGASASDVSDVDDASDFVAFFPRASADICCAALGGRLELFKTLESCGKAGSRTYHLLKSLFDQSPYFRGEFPFIQPALIDGWREMKRQKDAK